MINHHYERLAFRDAAAVLRRWEGSTVRVRLTDRPSSVQDIAAEPEVILQRVEPISLDLPGFAGDGLALTFSLEDGTTIFTNLMLEEFFEHVTKSDHELRIGNGDLEVTIQKSAGR